MTYRTFLRWRAVKWTPWPIPSFLRDLARLRVEQYHNQVERERWARALGVPPDVRLGPGTYELHEARARTFLERVRDFLS